MTENLRSQRRAANLLTVIMTAICALSFLLSLSSLKENPRTHTIARDSISGDANDNRRSDPVVPIISPAFNLKL
ncbi:hypothetical protein [Kiloniella majae]|uniref:hypothetical protein n=1 Tax=Kiloniella majae TaxID=1938558 RepID=UPI000A27792F|nr:hypothetical protein [Kiloniella majae]